MNKFFKYILVLLFATSCINNSIDNPKKPKNLIKKDKMADIIFDMSIFTAAKGVNKRIIESNGILPEAYIYKKYNIDSTQFAQSNEYYAYNLETYEEIYGKVKARLEAEKVYYDSVIDAEHKQRSADGKELRRRRDSIKNEKGFRRKEDLLVSGMQVGKNLIDYSKKISNWSPYSSGLAVAPSIEDDQAIAPNGDIGMSSVRLELGGGTSASDRSMIRLLDIPLTEDNYVYSFWIKAKNLSDVGKTIRILPEAPGGVETIHTLTEDLKKVRAVCKIKKTGSYTFLIELRGNVTNTDVVEFYLWDVRFEKILETPELKKIIPNPVKKADSSKLLIRQ